MKVEDHEGQVCYGVSVAIWDHTFHLTQVNASSLNRQADTRFTHTGGMEGEVDLRVIPEKSGRLNKNLFSGKSYLNVHVGRQLTWIVVVDSNHLTSWNSCSHRRIVRPPRYSLTVIVTRCQHRSIIAL